MPRNRRDMTVRLVPLESREADDARVGGTAAAGLYMQRGDRVRAEAVHTELEARAVTSRVPFFSRADSALYLGRLDEAVDLAIQSARLRDAIGPIWYRWPDIEALQAHPRYDEVLGAMRA